MVEHAELHQSLIDAANSSDYATSPTRLVLICGIGKCRKRLGEVRATNVGLVWVPELTDPHVGPERPFGVIPAMLPVSSAKQREYFCEIVTAASAKHKAWEATTVERLRNETPKSGKREVEARRVVVAPAHWGPLVNDPTLWTDEQTAAAKDAFFGLLDGTWPPRGVSRAAASPLAGRVAVIATAASRRDVVDFLDRLWDGSAPCTT